MKKRYKFARGEKKATTIKMELFESWKARNDIQRV